jgi:hypothetical protein
MADIIRLIGQDLDLPKRSAKRLVSEPAAGAIPFASMRSGVRF